MFNKFLSKKSNRNPRVFLLLLLLVAMVLATTQCSSSEETEEPEQAAETTDSGETTETAEESTGNITLAIEHFSVIEGTTWSGAHDRAGERLAEKYDNVDYEVVKDAVCLDDRIGNHYNNVEKLWGGHCLYKDLNSLIFSAEKIGFEPCIAKSVLKRNVEYPYGEKDWENMKGRAIINLEDE